MLRPVSGIKRRENPVQSSYPLGVQALRPPLGPVLSQRLVSNAADHTCNVMDVDSYVKSYLTRVSGVFRQNGAPGRTRTCDPKLRRLVGFL